MCGIVGYIGNEDVKDIILTGIKTLEYRGYDSSGMALVDKKDHIKIYRAVGRISNLEKLLKKAPASNIGIAHTRWATHGKPSIENSHPQTSMRGKIVLVHNGVIENYLELKEELIQKKYKFVSETDTEVIANLIEDKYMETKDMKKALMNMIERVHGSYALGIICADNPHKLYCVKNKTPMLAGVGQGFNMIASDAMALIHKTDQFIEINDQEFLEVTEDSIQVFNKDGKELKRKPFTSKINNEDVDLGLYPHYMLKEIDEQPSVIRTLISKYLTEGKIDSTIIREIKRSDRLYIIASGTSMHAGLVGKILIEELAHIPVEVHLGSEFGYHTPCLSRKPLFIFITQSGETADSRVALQKVKKMGHRSLTITNVEGSTLSREADHTLLLHAGPEIAVASTKAYVAQVTLLSIIANELAVKNRKIADLVFELGNVASVIEEIMTRKEEIHQLTKDNIIQSRNCFYIGRILDYCVALEAALKLKEISYIQTEGFASGELKHGTIALIEEGTPVIGLISQSKVALNTRSAIQEVKARGANSMTISLERLSKKGDTFVVSDVHELLSPLAMVVVTQLISYYAALEKGLDIDKPRNLAKSVTVE